jgi:hypothetical protein
VTRNSNWRRARWTPRVSGLSSPTPEELRRNRRAKWAVVGRIVLIAVVVTALVWGLVTWFDWAFADLGEHSPATTAFRPEGCAL